MDWDRYATAWAGQHGGYDQRRAAAPVRGFLRLGYRLARVLAALAIRPAPVAVAGLALAVAVPLAAGRDQTGPLLAAALVLLSALATVVERALRVLTGRANASGLIGAAVAARLGETAWLAGCWVLGVSGPLLVACGALTGLYEYVRTQALAAGMSPIGTQTLAERPMRVSVMVSGLALAALSSLGSGLLTIAALVWLLLTAHGLVRLTGALRRSVGGAR